MLRPILAILITAGLLIGTYSYISFANSVRHEPVQIHVDYASGDFSIKIERSFDCAGHPIFKSKESLKVLFKGEKVYGNTGTVPADEAVEIKKISGVEAGENEIFVSANMASASSGLGVIKVTVSRNDIPISEELITSKPGLTAVGGPIVFTIPDDSADAKEEKHQH